MRPRQWVKNVLVAAGPVAAGTILTPHGLRGVVLAFVTFSLVASGIYLLNDVLDRESDRQHPVKRNRPIASGALPVPVASVLAGLLLVLVPVGLVLAGEEGLATVLGIYAVVQTAYCIWLKHQVVIDLAIVSSGFLLRAVAGGVAADVALSPWFLLVAAFGSMFMVAGKRYSEVHLVGEGKAATRRSLEAYSASYLRFVWGIAASATVVFYSLWAFSLPGHQSLLSQLSIAPFVVAILRYAIDIDRGGAGEPESVVLGDRTLQVLGVLWLGLFGAAVVLA
jgi:decaprenyl-phosphate phosphoribosyltransferase